MANHGCASPPKQCPLMPTSQTAAFFGHPVKRDLGEHHRRPDRLLDIFKTVCGRKRQPEPKNQAFPRYQSLCRFYSNLGGADTVQR
jgi:hypothetical protein